VNSTGQTTLPPRETAAGVDDDQTGDAGFQVGMDIGDVSFEGQPAGEVGGGAGRIGRRYGKHSGHG
jgi:hypothetical protein